MFKNIDGLHYCPDNGVFGDAMPIYHDGEYHGYFNKPGNEIHGGWGHIATKDFLTWIEHPNAFGYEDPEHGRNIGFPSNSGCVIWGEGEWHAYYVGFHPGSDRLVCRHSVSEDGITFRYLGEIFERLEDSYRQDWDFRDPYVVYNEEDGLWHMVFCAKVSSSYDGPNHYNGAAGHAVSKDLYHWECLEPLDLRGVAGFMECPDLFRDPATGRWVLIYYFHETRIRTAPSLSGPWERGKTLSPTGFDFMAGRRMSEGERHILLGWIGQKERPGFSAPRCMGYPRELRLLEDGKTPAVRFIREIEQDFCVPCPEIVCGTAIPGGPGWHVGENRIEVEHPAGGTTAGWKRLPKVCYIKLDLTLANENGEAEIQFLGVPSDGADDPSKDWVSAGAKVIVDTASGLLRVRGLDTWDQVGDLNVMPYPFKTGEPIRFEILRDGDILEIGINGERTVSTTVNHIGENFGISVQDSGAVIENLSVRTRGKEST